MHESTQPSTVLLPLAQTLGEYFIHSEFLLANACQGTMFILAKKYLQLGSLREHFYCCYYSEYNDWHSAIMSINLEK